MSGKAVLIVVTGFSFIFLVVGQNFGSISIWNLHFPDHCHYDLMDPAAIYWRKEIGI